MDVPHIVRCHNYYTTKYYKSDGHCVSVKHWMEFCGQ